MRQRSLSGSRFHRGWKAFLDGFNTDPVIAHGRLIVEHIGALPNIRGNNIEGSVIVEISSSQPSADPLRRKLRFPDRPATR